MIFQKFAIKYPSEHRPGGYYYSQFFDHKRIVEMNLNPRRGVIKKVKLTVLDSEVPGCYYGWMDNDGKLSMVWYSQMLLAVCFGNQQVMDMRLAAGDGKMVWLRVEETSCDTASVAV